MEVKPHYLLDSLLKWNLTISPPHERGARITMKSSISSIDVSKKQKTNKTVEQWRKTLLPESATVKDAIICLNQSGLQIALVVTEDNTLVGTLTDGDIRKGMLRGIGFESPVSTVVNRSPVVVSPEIDRTTALQLMTTNAFNSIPVVDKQRHVVGLHLLNELIAPAKRPNIMVIMAGGKGTRLRPHTENCPKPLLPINGKPMLEHIIERAKADGFRCFVLAVHYLGHMIKDYFGDGSEWGVEIDYLDEGLPLGTAGALSLLNAPNEPFVVTNGDVLTDIDYGELLAYHCRHDDVAATMAVRLHEWELPFGVVSINGIDITGFQEKPVTRCHINAGVYVLDPCALELLIDSQECDMPTLFSRLQSATKRTIVYPIHELWMDVGRVEDYFSINGKN